jgi:TolB-like protein
LSHLTGFYEQLKDRRVIRAALVYVALFWLLLQVADLLAEAGMLSQVSVRWLILLGLIGFPITLITSWFFEGSWHGRRWPAVLGDVAIISAVAAGALLLAWQHWFTSFTRPVLAVIRIEATDTRDDTADLAHHLAARFRLLLATRQEIRVIEIESSLQQSLSNLPIAEKAETLNADLLLGGTINQGESDIRLNLQLFSADGELIWSERFQDRLIDQSQLQNRVLSELWPYLPIPDGAYDDVQDLVMACKYPANREAIFAIARFGRSGPGDAVELTSVLTPLIEQQSDNGLLHLARANIYFRLLSIAPPRRRPVLQRLAVQDLDRAEQQCPGYPEIALARIYNTLQLKQENLQAEAYLSRFPNEAHLNFLLARHAQESGDVVMANALAEEAFVLNGANMDIRCLHQELLQSDSATDAREGVTCLD